LGGIHIRCDLPDAPKTAEGRDPADSTSAPYGQPWADHDPNTGALLPPALNNDTDFEQGLTVIFQIPDQIFSSKQDIEDRMNRDFLFSSLRDETLSKDEFTFENETSYGVEENYRKLWAKVEASSTDEGQLTDEDAYLWKGEVGRFYIPRMTSRDFMWSLHNDPKNTSSSKVSRHQQQNNSMC
jgi:hypothetical protein